MNRVILALIFSGLFSGLAFTQSLGDVARQNRQIKRKPASHVYTDDDISSSSATEKFSAKPQDSTSTPSSSDSAQSKDSTNPAATEKSDTNSEEALKKNWDSFKTRVADQKSKIDLLQRELNVLVNENQIQVARYYADAGAQLRDPKAWTDQQKKNQDGIDAKTKALQDAKDALEAIREEGRKAGVPSSYLD